MIEDMEKAPRAKNSAPAMSVLDRQIEDAKGRMDHAPNNDLRRMWAERLIGLRFERGDFTMIPRLDPGIRRALVTALLKERQA